MWFGRVLQTRPALLDPIPKIALSLISNSHVESVAIRERDPEDYKDKPFHFFV